MTIGYGHEDANAIFELQAEVFHRMTGLVAPGKDVPWILAGEIYESKRQAAWNEWLNHSAVAVRITYITMKEQERNAARTTE